MSLINDALKKAQKQRTGEAPALASMPSVGGESAARISRRAKSGGPSSMLIGAGAAIVVLLLAGGYFAFRPSTPVSAPPPAAGKPASPTLPPATKPAAPGPETAPPAFVLPLATPPKADTPPQRPEDRESKTAANPAPSSSPAAKSPAGGEIAPAAPAPSLKLEPRAIQYIDNIKVAGIRASATDAKVLMNDRVYRVGSTVEAEMGLKLAGITANSLTFEDERGARYTRTF